MKKFLKIDCVHNNSVLDICLDTIRLKKQAIVFVNSKSSSEAEAERISKKVSLGIGESGVLSVLSEKVLSVLPNPTKQCKRLALCVKNGVAFHHSGLHAKQRDIIESAFRSGVLKIICGTTTLALGLNLPAFRVIIRDLKRFVPPRGMANIPVLEYLQFCGRAGRPDFNEEFGEAICIAQNDSQKNDIIDNYVLGEPEDILSKLAVEPVLRTYILSLIAIGFADTKVKLVDFFNQTFYAFQFGDNDKIGSLIEDILVKLVDWNFIESNGVFLTPTLLGKRISELYLDPFTANYFIDCFSRATDKIISPFSFLQLVSNTIELRPLLAVKMSEYDFLVETINSNSDSIISVEPSMFDLDYEDFLRSVKTAFFFDDWINEFDEEVLLEKYSIRPGEIRAKNDLCDWLLYSCEEIAKLTKNHYLVKDIGKLRFRLKHGAKEELISLLRLKDIGRVRARKLFDNKIKTLEDVKNIDPTTLSELVGKGICISIKKQVGIDVDEEKIKVAKTKRKGQTSLLKYDGKKPKK